MLGANTNLNRLALHRRVAGPGEEKNLLARDIIDEISQVLGDRADPEPAPATPPGNSPGKGPVVPGPVSPPVTSTPAPAPTPPNTPATRPTPKTEGTPVVSPVVPSTTPTPSPTRATSTTPTTSSTPVSTSSAAPPAAPVIHSSSTTPATKPAIRTNIAGVSSSASSTVIHSPTSTSASSSSSGTGSIVGGVAGGLLAIGALVLLGMFCMRRVRRRSARKNLDENFRHSTFLANSTARPPTMIERSIANRGPTTYGAISDGNSQHYSSTYGTNGYNTFGQPATPDPFTPNSSAPLMPNNYQADNAPRPYNGDMPNNAAFPPSGYATNPFSPGPFSPGPFSPSPFSPGVPSNDQYSTHQTQAEGTGLSRTPSAAPSYVSRTNSRDGYKANLDAAQAAYTELDRSPLEALSPQDRESVTPFQAAQYAEIARRLNTDLPPAGYTKEMEALQEEGNHSPLSPAPEYSQKPHDSERVASDPFNPAPPVPAYGQAARIRIDSVPPMLPDIPRSFSPVVADFGGSKSVNSPTGVGAVHSPLSGAGMSYPTSAVVGDNAVATPRPAVVAPTHAEIRGRQVEDRGRPETIYTIYDPEDAYGGF